MNPKDEQKPIYRSSSNLPAWKLAGYLNECLDQGYHLKEILKDGEASDPDEDTYYPTYTVLVVLGA